MIKLNKKSDCCGCRACIQKCPKQCISFIPDSEGFFYPFINEEKCIDCGLCEKVCPVINQGEAQEPLAIFAAVNTEEKIRKESSSGGIFTLLAKEVIAKGGVVFGAKFNDQWKVVHDYTETEEGLAAFRGSKYVQSNVSCSYTTAEAFLKQNRHVLYSGTPCQIAGLRKYLRKDYPHLITVDFVCHGVPSPLVWERYLDEKLRPKGAAGKNTVSLSLKAMPTLGGVSFRDKRNGWKKFGFALFDKSASKADKNSVSPSIEANTILYEPLGENVYLHGFIRNLFLRPSCYHCPAKSFKSHSDYTLADFWGAKDYMEDDDKGISLLFVHKNKLGIDTHSFKKITMAAAIGQNPAIVKSAKPKDGRDAFFNALKKENTSVEKLTRNYSKYSFKESLRNNTIKFLASTGLLPFIKSILLKR